MRIYYMEKDSKGSECAWIEITDLYFFEEQDIHSFRGTDIYDSNYIYKFVIQSGDILESEQEINIIEDHNEL